jgi:hypothetical protein
MNVNRRSWLTTDDYLAEKQGMQRANSLLKSTASVPQFGTYQRSQFARPAPAGSLQKNQETVQAKNPGQPFTAPAPRTVLNVGQSLPIPGSRAGDTAPDEQPLTQQQVSAQLTTAYTSQQMNEALQSLVDFNNRKFKYNAKESPLYTILEQQAAEEARLASGRAYARSVANTGGYGSSYATLAAEEASRQVMEGMNDQQYALYQAAKDEFEAERQSRLDWYNMTKQMHEDAMILEEYEKLKAEEEARAAGGLTETVQNAYNAAMQIWDGTNEAQVRSALKNQGLTDAEIEATVGMLREDTRAAITDTYKQFEISPTLSGASEIVTEAKQIGNYEEVAGQVSATLSKSITDAMDDLSTGYKVLGVDHGEWDAMDDASKADMIIQSAGEAVKAGVMSENDYLSVLTKDLDDDITTLKKEAPGRRTKGILANVEGLMVLRNEKYLSEEAYEEALNHVIDTTDISDNFHETKIPGKGTGYQIALQHNFRLESGETDALIEIMRVYGKREKNKEGRG